MRCIFAALALALISPAGTAGIPASELSIGGVASGASEASVVRRLGPPTKRVETGEGTELHYPNLVATIGWLEQRAPKRQRRVLAVLGTGRKTCTPKGLCPGMPSSVAARLYGATKPTPRETGTFLEYQPEDVGCWLQISAPVDVINQWLWFASPEGRKFVQAVPASRPGRHPPRLGRVGLIQALGLFPTDLSLLWTHTNRDQIMAWEKVESYSFGFKPSDKKYWLYFTLQQSNSTHQVFLSPTQFTAAATMFQSSSTIDYETTGGYFSTGPRTL
ncbi:MAG: hypothetical protein EOO16_12525 [Chitinophagaceae bacterium]|nr:MAG: hypothetical protein EOO16_12525 [Chitinophagaceae bacterium]